MTRVLCCGTRKKTWSGRKPRIAHLHEFRSIAYVIVLEDKRVKLDGKGLKCSFLGYCEGMKVHRLMCLETKKIIKNKEVVFMKDCGSIKMIYKCVQVGEV